jgi:hypothetical protein
MGYTSLNNIDGIIDGDVNVSFNIKLDAASNTDEYWTMAWEVQPTLAMQPNRCEQWVDGVKVAECVVEPNWSDKIFPVVAAVTDEKGAILSYVNNTGSATFANAVANGGYVTLLADIKLTGMLTISEGKKLTLDLNGKSVSSSDNSLFELKSSGLTIKDSSVEKTGRLICVNEDVSGGNAFIVYDNASLMLDGVVVHAWNNVIYTYGSGINVTVRGGELKSFLQGSSPGCPFYLIWTRDNSSIVVESGLFLGPIMCYDSNLVIKGGQFTQDVSSYCDSGFKAVYSEASGYYEVVEVEPIDPTVAKAKIIIDGEEKYFASVAEALQVAKDAEVSNLELTLMGATSVATTDCFDLVDGTAFNSIVIKQNQINQPYYLNCVYTGDRTASDGMFVLDGVNLDVTEQIWFQCDVVLRNNSVLTRSSDYKNFIYNGKLTVEPGSRFVSQIDDVMAGSLIVDGGKTDGTFCEQANYHSVYVDVRNGQTLKLQNGAYMLLNGGNENGTLVLNGNADIVSSKLVVLNNIEMGNNARLTFDGDSLIETKSITGSGVISIDASGIVGEKVVVRADCSGFNGIVELLNNPKAEYEMTTAGLIVKPIPPVAVIGDVSYITLGAAFSAATNGSEIIVLRDAECESSIALSAGREFTLDLNGKKIYGNEGVQLLNAGGLVICDSSTEKNGISELAIVNSGKLAISSGHFAGAISGAGEFAISGGTYTQDVSAWCAEGYKSVKQPNASTDQVIYKVGRIPNAIVDNLGPTTVTSADFGSSYWEFNLVTGTKDGNKKDPFDLQVVLNFIAKDSPEQAAKSAYANYITDFRIKIEGIEGGSFTADDDCYLAGYYPAFGTWVKVKLTDFPVQNGVGYPVITGLLPMTYQTICMDVKNFICGIHLSENVLKNNPNLKVSLELGLAESVDDMLSGNGFVQVGETYDYSAAEMLGPVAISGSDYFTTVKSAVDAASESGESVKLVNSAELSENLTIASDLVLNLGGKTLKAKNDYKLSIDGSIVTITNGTLSAFSAENVTLAGNAIMTVTDKNVADSFRATGIHYVSKNGNDTYSIMLKTAFRSFITVVNGTPRLGFFKDIESTKNEYTLLAATNLENPEWKEVKYVESLDVKESISLPLHWTKLDQDPNDTNTYRFFKIQVKVSE